MMELPQEACCPISQIPGGMFGVGGPQLTWVWHVSFLWQIILWVCPCGPGKIGAVRGIILWSSREGSINNFVALAFLYDSVSAL